LGARAKAVRVDPLGIIPLDLPGVQLVVERRHWPEGGSCLNAQKWGTLPKRGTYCPWMGHMLQLPWALAEPVLEQLLAQVREAKAAELCEPVR
jgi:hypothetical protein